MPDYKPWERPGPVEFIKGWADAQLPDRDDYYKAIGAVGAGYVLGKQLAKKKKKKK